MKTGTGTRTRSATHGSVRHRRMPVPGISHELGGCVLALAGRVPRRV